MTLKSFRKIDRRNLLYGKYTYQVRPGRMRDTNFWTIEKWCEEKWGPASTWVFSGGRGWKQHNVHWRIDYLTGRRTPLIYLKGDAEAMMFSLVWADK